MYSSPLSVVILLTGHVFISIFHFKLSCSTSPFFILHFNRSLPLPSGSIFDTYSCCGNGFLMLSNWSTVAVIVTLEVLPPFLSALTINPPSARNWLNETSFHSSGMAGNILSSLPQLWSSISWIACDAAKFPSRVNARMLLYSDSSFRVCGPFTWNPFLSVQSI